MPTYLDENGNPIAQAKVYLDANGNPLGQVVDHKARLAALQNAAGPGDAGLQSTFLNDTPLGQIISGAGKGVASTALHLGAAAHHLPGMDTIAPDRAGAFDPNSELFQNVEAHAPLEKAAKAAEQVGEFFIPGAAEAGALAPVANAVGKAGLLGRMATEGVNAAGVTAAQGGDPVSAGVTGAVVPAVAAGIGKLAPKAINTLIGAKASSFKTGANAGEGITNAGIVAPTLAGVAQRVAKAKDALGQRIGAVLNGPAGQNVTMNVTNVINKPIDDAISGLDTIGAHGTVTRLEEMRNGLNDAFQKVGASPKGATPSQVFAVKKLLDKSINHGSSEGVEASAKEVARSIRRGLAQAITDSVPVVSPLNKQYGNLAEAADAIADKMNASQGMQGYFRNPVNWLLGGGTALAHHPVGAIGALAAKEALTSPLAVTAGAQAARGVGSTTGQQIGARLGGAAASGATQDDNQ